MTLTWDYTGVGQLVESLVLGTRCWWFESTRLYNLGMNGFDSNIRQRVFSMAPAVTVGAFTGSLSDWQIWQRKLQNITEVRAAAPFVREQGLLRHFNNVSGVTVEGILPEQEQKIIPLKQAGYNLI